MLWSSMFAGIWALGLVFAACELSQRISNAFNDVYDALSQVDWYLLPTELQRHLIPIMMYAQQPIIIQFFGSISCSREQCQRVNDA